MNCTRARKYFSEFFDGRLESSLADQLDDHLNDCDVCSKAYASYDKFFTALRSVPMARTERPAPLPETAAAFVRPQQKLSLAAKLGRIAAVGLLIVTAAHTGYKLGTKSNAPNLSATTGDAGDTSSASFFPTNEVGGRLRRSVDATRNLAVLMNRVPRSRDSERAVDAVSNVLQLAPLGSDAQFLQNAESKNYGAYEKPIREFADEVTVVLGDLRESLKQNTDGRARLGTALGIVNRSRLAERVAELESVARNFEPPPYVDPFSAGVIPIKTRYEVDHSFVSGWLRSLAGQPNDARISFERYIVEQPDSPLVPQAEAQLLQFQLQLNGATLSTKIRLAPRISELLFVDESLRPEWQSLIKGGSYFVTRIIKLKDGEHEEESVVIQPPRPTAPLPPVQQKRDPKLRDGKL